MNKYVGHPLQTRGAEEYVLQNGMGNGMRFLYIRNGLGLEAWISLDRAADLSRVIFKGDNFGFFSPSGYVSPMYYDRRDAEFLKSFTAGFCTTCGLTTVGGCDEDNGEYLPMHGTISNTPSILNGIEETEEGITVKTTVRDCRLFGNKLILKRSYFISYKENKIVMSDAVTNERDDETPFMVLYHCNMGYPLLTENSILKIPNHSMAGRDAHAKKYEDTALIMEKPQARIPECCFYYDVKEKNGLAHAGIFNKEIGKGTVFSYKKAELPYLTEWKMMGETDYVLGIEPGNCTPNGRKYHRENGTLVTLAPGETKTTGVTFDFLTDFEEFENSF